jgi:DNA-binding transcriptional regulator YbjK
MGPVTVARVERGRGKERHERLLEATIELIGREGVDAVTHRRVADLAKVPLGSTTYYFASRDQMLVDALKEFGRQEIESLHARFAELPSGRPSKRRYVDELVEFLVPQVNDDPWRTLAQYTLLVEAARRPELSELARDWNQAWLAVLKDLFVTLGANQPELEARMLLAMLDGLLIEQLAAPDPAFASDVLRPALQRMFDIAQREGRGRGDSSSGAGA